MAGATRVSGPHELVVVTVSYGSEGVLPSFVSSLRDAATVRPYDLVVADNRPQPDSGSRRIAEESNATYLPLDNPGYGGAVNEAASRLDPRVEWIVISNPDVVFRPGAVDTMVAVAETDERIGAVGPQILTADGDVYPSARSVPSARTGAGHAIFGRIWPRNPWTSRYLNSTEYGRERDAGWLSGACLLVRRSAFDSIGGFDSEFFMYFEDVDLGYRLGKAGFRNVYVPAATVVHTGAHATVSHRAEMVTAHHRSARRFLSKKYPGPLLAPVRIVGSVGLRLREVIVRRML